MRKRTTMRMRTMSKRVGHRSRSARSQTRTGCCPPCCCSPAGWALRAAAVKAGATPAATAEFRRAWGGCGTWHSAARLLKQQQQQR